MRGKQQATVAVCQPDGTIAYKHMSLTTRSHTSITQLPFIRGVVALWDMLKLGIESLTFSAAVATGDNKELTTKELVLSLMFAVFFAVGLFFITPLLIAAGIGYMGVPPLAQELIESVVRLGVIIGYIVIIGNIPDIQRVFGYHGAEHKTVNAYEAGAPLTVESVRQYSTIHPRCGTSFLVVVVVLSAVVFAFLGWLPFWGKVASRIVLVPLIAAVAYEVLRLSAQHRSTAWVQFVTQPLLAVQRLTTREPDDTMIVTAIAALTSVLAADGINVQSDMFKQETRLVAAHGV